MAVRQIVLMGDPMLRVRSSEVGTDEIQSPEFKKLIDDMVETAQQNPEDGFITAGLAAPQIGVPLRIFLALQKGSPRRNPRYDVYINPQLEYPSNEIMESEESCLSTPRLCGMVNRYREVRISYLDIRGERHREKISGERSVFVQHENDHLDGILWVDRVIDTKTLRFC